MASGAGAESRTAIGVVVIGGTVVSTLITLFVTPAFYLLLARFTKPIHEVARRLSSLEDAHPLHHDHAPEAAE
jgi:multidrug efflux pump